MSFSYKKVRPNVLVTGACGLLAKSIIPKLEPRFEVFRTDVTPPPAGKGLSLQTDLTNFDQVLESVKGMEAILHLAVASVRNFEDFETPSHDVHPFDRATLDVNVTGTFHLFEAARRAGVRRIVYASSLTAYFGNRHREHYGPTTPLDPWNLYACTKIFGENLGRVYHREHKLSFIALRFGQPYPIGLPKLDEFWKKSKRSRSTYIAMEDIARAVSCGLETEIDYGIYNVVSASDNPRFDLRPAKEIGYVPRGYFSDKGLDFYDAGNFPPHNGKIVIN